MPGPLTRARNTAPATLLPIACALLVVACSHAPACPTAVSRPSPFPLDEEDLGPTIRTAVAQVAQDTPADATAPTHALPALAVLDRNAWLYVAPDLSARRYRAMASPTGRYVASHNDLRKHTNTVRVLDQGDGWVTIETGHVASCNDVLLPALAVRFYVRADVLLPVTTRALRFTHPDGTEIALPAGVPLPPFKKRAVRPIDSDGAEIALPASVLALTATIAVRPWTFRVLLPDDAIGTTFPAEPLRPSPPDLDADWIVTADARPTVVGTEAWSDYADGRASSRPADSVVIPVAVVRRDATDTLIEAKDECGSVRALLPTSQVERNTAAEGGEEGGHFGFGVLRHFKFSIAAGAPLSWPEGFPAGSVVEDVQVESAERRKGRACAVFRLDVFGRPDALVPLCFPERYLTDL